MLLSVFKRFLNGNPLLIFLVSLVLVVSTYDDLPHTRSTDLLIPSLEEIEDLSSPQGIPGHAGSFCYGSIPGDALLGLKRHAGAAAFLSEVRPRFLSAPIHIFLHAYRAPPCPH